MGKYRKLTHVYYKCDYHIVFSPKYRFQILEGIFCDRWGYDQALCEISRTSLKSLMALWVLSENQSLRF